jgi:hypothetical protein
MSISCHGLFPILFKAASDLLTVISNEATELQFTLKWKCMPVAYPEGNELNHTAPNRLAGAFEEAK